MSSTVSPLLSVNDDADHPRASAIDAVGQRPRDQYDCPICSSFSRRYFQACGFWIRQCEACGHQFAELENLDGHINRCYGDDYFTGGGPGYTDYLGENRLLIARGRWVRPPISKTLFRRSVLDVGTAAGFTLGGFRDAGWTTQGIEPNAGMARHARERLGLQVEHASLETWESNSTFDLVLMLQVLPHFLDPAAALRQAGQLVRSGGYLLIETWDRESWTAVCRPAVARIQSAERAALVFA